MSFSEEDPIERLFARYSCRAIIIPLPGYSVEQNPGGFDGKPEAIICLSPVSKRMRLSNHLRANLLTAEFGIGRHIMRAAFDCAVVFDPADAVLPDGTGTFFWGGAAGT
jgi:hypothetical protein